MLFEARLISGMLSPFASPHFVSYFKVAWSLQMSKGLLKVSQRLDGVGSAKICCSYIIGVREEDSAQKVKYKGH